MIKIITELIVSIIVGIWVSLRLLKDSQNYIDTGWHSNVSSQSFMTFKVVMMIVVTFFFVYRILVLIRQLWAKRVN